VLLQVSGEPHAGLLRVVFTPDGLGEAAKVGAGQKWRLVKAWPKPLLPRQESADCPAWGDFKPVREHRRHDAVSRPVGKHFPIVQNGRSSGISRGLFLGRNEALRASRALPWGLGRLTPKNPPRCGSEDFQPWIGRRSARASNHGPASSISSRVRNLPSLFHLPVPFPRPSRQSRKRRFQFP
jgi:hypothetical protein